MKKVVLKLVLQDEKEKQKAMRKVSGLQGVDSIAVDMKEKKLTVTGEIDPVRVVSKLKKPYCPQIVSVGPAKEEKKEEKKGKDENKKENKDENNKKKDTKGNNVIVPAVPIPEPYRLFYPPQYPMNYQYQYQHPAYHPPAQVHPHHYFERSAEEDPNACVIC